MREKTRLKEILNRKEREESKRAYQRKRDTYTYILYYREGKKETKVYDA